MVSRAGRGRTGTQVRAQLTGFATARNPEPRLVRAEGNRLCTHSHSHMGWILDGQEAHALAGGRAPTHTDGPSWATWEMHTPSEVHPIPPYSPFSGHRAPEGGPLQKGLAWQRERPGCALTYSPAGRGLGLVTFPRKQQETHHPPAFAAEVSTTPQLHISSPLCRPSTSPTRGHRNPGRWVWALEHLPLLSKGNK